MYLDTNLLEANLKVLRERYPELATSYRKPEGIEIFRTESGHPSLKFNGRLLHSRYDPVKEAQRLVGRVDLKRVDLIFVFGVGLGYHLKELSQRVGSNTLILAIEPQPDIFFAALTSVDLRAILTLPNLELSVGEGQKEVLQRLNHRFDILRTIRIYTLEHTPSIKLNPAYFEELKVKIQDFIDQKVTQALTLSQFGYDFQRNIIQNIPEMVNSPGVKELFGRFKSMPAIIVAAGPSLERDLQALKDAEDKALLISAATVLSTLHEQRIRPDLVVVIDPQAVNLRYFKDIDLYGFLVLGSVAYWEIGKLSSPKFFFLSDHPICHWFAKFDDKGSIDISGGSVTTASFDLALKLGADPIILVGTDFAYTEGLIYTQSILEGFEDLNTLSKFYTLEMMRREFLTKDSVFPIEGVGGRRVLTNKVLSGYLGWLEERIESLPSGLEVINTSRGARIKGTKELSLKQALKWYCTKRIPVKEIIEESWTRHSQVDIPSLIQEIEFILEELAQIKKLSDQKIESLKERVLNYQLPELDRYQRTIDLLEVALYANSFNRLYEISKMEEDQSLKRSLILIEGLSKVSSFTLELFKKVKERLNNWGKL